MQPCFDITDAVQVNVATRDAALAPGGMDSMTFFEGKYSLQPLITKTHMKPVEVLISTNNGEQFPLGPFRVLSDWPSPAVLNAGYARTINSGIPAETYMDPSSFPGDDSITGDWKFPLSSQPS